MRASHGNKPRPLPVKLDLYIPGLLAVPARLRRALALPDAPALKAWCARANTVPTRPGRYGFPASALALQQAPVAALTWLGAGAERSAAGALLATPVHFKAAMDDLVLFGGPALDVSAPELDTLGRDLGAFFGDEPKVIRHGRHLFLASAEPLEVQTTPLHLAQGQAVRSMLPHGRDARRLNAWLNELQMFLHDHDINRARESAGKPALNGLWPWGEGALPGSVAQRAAVHAESDALRGLGRLLGEVRDGVVLDAALAGEGAQIVESTACVDALDADDIEGWQRAVSDVDEKLLAPVLAWLEKRNDVHAVLHAGDGVGRTIGHEGWWKGMARRYRRGRVPELVEEA